MKDNKFNWKKKWIEKWIKPRHNKKLKKKPLKIAIKKWIFTEKKSVIKTLDGCAKRTQHNQKI